jgi:exopolysaccharide biosynthesis polyprenyl glycosylphosphotransferase
MSGHSAVSARQAGLAVARLGAWDSTWVTAYIRTLAMADGVCAFGGGVLAVLARPWSWGHPHHAPYLLFTGLLPVVWWVAVVLAGGYDRRFIGVGSDEFRRVAAAGVSVIAVIAFVAYAAKNEFARGYVVVALPSATASALAARYVLRKRLHRRRRYGACARRVVAVGYAASVMDLIIELRRETKHGLAIVGACLAEGPVLAEIAGVPVHGGLTGIPAAVASFEADTVAVLACPELGGHRLRELAWDLEETGTDLCLLPALLDVAVARTTVSPVAGLPMLQVDHPKLSGVRQFIKAEFDRVVALLALLLVSPLLGTAALAIKLSDRGPVLFRQTRVGRNGKTFTLYKFRSMVVDAEARRAQLEPRNEMNGVLFKIRKDPRLTPLGAWLRRWSVDELPQLLNVVWGQMSLVGPRPWRELPYQEAAIEHDYVRRRLAVKPGITGLWQVSGRADLPWEESLRLDVHYVENWSFLLDLRILWKTGRAVMRRSGAY